MKQYFLSFCLVFAFGFVGFGQVDTVSVMRELDSLISVMSGLIDKKQLDKAQDINDAAANLALNYPGKTSMSYVNICIAQGKIWALKMDFPKAENIFNEAISIQANLLGREHSDNVKNLNNIGMFYFDLREFKKAETYLIEAKDIVATTLGKNHLDYAKHTSNLARLYYNAENYGEAEPYYLEAKELFEKLSEKERPEYASVLNGLASLYQAVGKFENSELLFLEALALRERLFGKHHPDYALTLGNMGILYRSMGKLEKAEHINIEVLAIYEKIYGKEHTNYARVLTRLAFIYQVTGRYEKAVLLTKDAISIQEKTVGKEHPNYAGALLTLANLYYMLGEHKESESLYLETIAIQEKTLGKAHTAYARSLHNLGNLYMEANNFKKAKELYLTSKEIREKALGKEHAHYAESTASLALLYHLTGEYLKSESMYQEALSIQGKSLGKNHVEYAGTLIDYANLLKTQRNYEKAEEIYLESKAIFENELNIRRHPKYLISIESLGNLYAETGNFEKAETFLWEAKTVREELYGKDHVAHTLSLLSLGRFYWKMGNHQKSEQLFTEAIGNQKLAAERAVQHLSENELFKFLQQFESDLHHYFSFANNQHQTNEGFFGTCYDNALFFRGFLLNSSNEIRRQILRDTSLSRQAQHLVSLRRNLGFEYTKPMGDRDSLAILSLESQVNVLEKDLARSISGYGDAIRQVTWQQVQSKLQPGEAALEFVHFNYYTPDPTDSVIYAALLLTPGMEQPFFVPLFEEKSLEGLLPPAGKNRSEFVSKLYQNMELSTLIWSPLEVHLQGIEKVYYSPSGLLHRINLAALPVSTEGATLSNRYDLIAMGSTRQLVVGNSPLATDNAPLATVFGAIQYEMDSTAIPATDLEELGVSVRGLAFSETDSTLRGGSWKYLKNSEKETTNIAAILTQAGIRVNTFKGYEASEEAFKAIGKPVNSHMVTSSHPVAGSPRILHLSTHGYFFPDRESRDEGRGRRDDGSAFKSSDHPMIRSGLILAGANHAWQTGRPLGNREDGVLTAYEISQMNLTATELVVLSACETGLGDIEGNEGVYGLQRAFKIAGAENLIMSLWQVPDYQTQELMTLFYQKWLLEKMSIHQSLHSAQEEMRQKGYEPFYWAGFVLVE